MLELWHAFTESKHGDYVTLLMAAMYNMSYIVSGLSYASGDTVVGCTYYRMNNREGVNLEMFGPDKPT